MSEDPVAPKAHSREKEPQRVKRPNVKSLNYWHYPPEWRETPSEIKLRRRKGTVAVIGALIALTGLFFPGLGTGGSVLCLLATTTALRGAIQLLPLSLTRMYWYWGVAGLVAVGSVLALVLQQTDTLPELWMVNPFGTIGALVLAVGAAWSDRWELQDKRSCPIHKLPVDPKLKEKIKELNLDPDSEGMKTINERLAGVLSRQIDILLNESHERQADYSTIVTGGDSGSKRVKE
jgi:hypothetical protein